MILAVIFLAMALVVFGAWVSLQRRRKAYEATEPDDGSSTEAL